MEKGLKHGGKVSKALSGIGVAISVTSDLATDIKRNYSTDRIISNVVINTAVYYMNTFGTAWICGKIGAAVGSLIPIPIVGTIIGRVIGTAVGFGLGFLVNALLDYKINDKSIMDYIRDGFYDIFHRKVCWN